MQISALIMDFMGVLLQVRTDTPDVEHFTPHKLSLAAAKSGVAPTGYQVFDHYELNTELLEYLRLFNTKWPVILFTHGRMSQLPEVSAKLEGIFKRIMTAEDVGFEKDNPEAYLALAYRIGRSPHELLFVDDRPGNIAAAESAGCATRLYTDNTDLVKFLDAATN